MLASSGANDKDNQDDHDQREDHEKHAGQRILEQRISELEEGLARATEALGFAEERAREADAARIAAIEEASTAVAGREAVDRSSDLSAEQSTDQAAATAAVAAVAAAESAAAATVAEAEESAAAIRVELDVAREALRTARQELEETREAGEDLKVSFAEAERIAAVERAGMASRVAELERQAAEGYATLEAETSRAMSALGQVEELRAALGDMGREDAAGGLATAEARAEVADLQRQLDNASQVTA